MDEGDDHLIAWLRTRDVACPICAYNLRDLAGVHCPECGGRLRLHVGSDNMKLGAWFVGVLGLALALGFDGVVTTLMIGVFILEPPTSPGERQVVLTLIGCFVLLTVLAGMGVLAMVRARRRWARLGVGTQWKVAAAIFGGTFLAHAAWGLFLVLRL